MRQSAQERQAGSALALCLSMAALSFGCSSSGPPAPGSFTEVYATVLGTPTCTNDYCHYEYSSISFGALDLSSQTNAYWNLVDQYCAGDACGGMGRKRVIPGDPNGSILYLKISETNPACGIQMPANTALFMETAGGTTKFTGPALTTAQQQLIYNWILNGAQNN